VIGNSISRNYERKKEREKIYSKPTNQTGRGIQKGVSQKPYGRKLQKRVKLLEEDKDLEEMEEEEGNDGEIGEGTPAQIRRTPDNKDREIPSEKFSDQNHNQRPVYN
jgi:hypothetical protein